MKYIYKNIFLPVKGTVAELEEVKTMKVRTPVYYKDFKCIAGACTDTCCAGWEVDVEPASYEYYKKVKGKFGERLKAVMVPDGEGGCNFKLNNGRCPFLNDKLLCDLYTELGEDRLCDTCAEFPRFINVYGLVKEIGIAPSCKTAGELIFNYKDIISFDETEDGKPLEGVNDIDAFLYMQLLKARNTAYDIVQNEKYSVDEAAYLLLEYAHRIQKHMDKERDDLIGGIVKRFNDGAYLDRILEGVKNSSSDRGYGVIEHFFDEFRDMEIINPDWEKYVALERDFMKKMTKESYIKIYEQFDAYYADRQYEYRSLLVYYIFRYFLDAVNDYDVILKVKNAVIGYIILKHLDIVAYDKNGGNLGKTEQIDIAHLYSRQFEHSYTNFEAYSEMFSSKRIYSISSLKRILE